MYICIHIYRGHEFVIYTYRFGSLEILLTPKFTTEIIKADYFLFAPRDPNLLLAPLSLSRLFFRKLVSRTTTTSNGRPILISISYVTIISITRSDNGGIITSFNDTISI